MTVPNPAMLQRYLADSVATASPAKLLVMLYDRLVLDLNRSEEALRVGGYPGFLPALRKAPDVGYVELGGRKITIRWARQVPSGQGRTIVVVTDKPVVFIGGGAAEAKPRAGYEVAVLELKIDNGGKGTGTMAGVGCEGSWRAWASSSSAWEKGDAAGGVAPSSSSALWLSRSR